MTNIIVVLPKLEEAKGVKNILVRSGFQVTGICTTGTQAISQADGLNDGIVICSYKLADMIYTELHEDLPEGFEMLLMASQNLISECYGNGIVCLSMPLKVQDLINTVNLMVEGVERRRRKRPGFDVIKIFFLFAKFIAFVHSGQEYSLMIMKSSFGRKLGGFPFAHHGIHGCFCIV